MIYDFDALRDALDALRQEFHKVVDTTINEFVQGFTKEDGLTITPAEVLQQPYTHKWPKDKETFSEGRWYDVRGREIPAEGLRVLVARQKRDVWGKSQRPVAVVFGKLRTLEADKQLTPYAEFTADDHGTFAGVIPNPVRPREGLKSKDPLPVRFISAVVKSNDELFDSIKQGPSLRLVVQPNDEAAMAAHGVWVASLRNRF